MTGFKRTRVKICGVTSATDAQLAVRHGADAIGVVFAESPRRVAPDIAADILRRVQPFVSRVGVFADQPVDTVRDAVAQCPIDRVQLSGNEPAGVARALDMPLIKAVHVNAAEDIERHASYPAQWFLLDAPAVEGRMGGTGERFGWNEVRDLPWHRDRVIVAGGLTPDNVGDVVAQLRPAAVDVSSGVELEPGIKDPEKVAAFLAAVREADARQRHSGAND
jgi:phosphoribosylanthranilate isomerase